jgi:hypothetical protein
MAAVDDFDRHDRAPEISFDDDSLEEITINKLKFTFSPLLCKHLRVV